MNKGKATIASVMCPVSLKWQFCFGHFTECLASNWWESISSSLYITPSWESVGREKCNSGKEKRKENCVLLYPGVPVPSYLKMVGRATVHIRMVPSGKLPPLLMWSQWHASDPHPWMPICPPAFPLIHSRVFHCLVVWMAIAMSLIFWHLSCLIPELAERPLLLASFQGQPWYLGYDHPIFSFGFCFSVDLEQYFFITSNFLWINSLNGPFYPNIHILIDHKFISTLESLYLLFPWPGALFPRSAMFTYGYRPGLNSNATSSEVCSDCPIKYCPFYPSHYHEPCSLFSVTLFPLQNSPGPLSSIDPTELMF